MDSSRWETGRIEAFSDGVFAIAITLLVLDLHVPARDFDELARGILHQWPSYLGYVTSFLTVGGIWMAHHGIFRRLNQADSRVMRINLLLLMAVSFLPFPTRLASEAFGHPDAERPAIIFYGVSLLVISVLLSQLWASATRGDLLHSDLPEAEVSAISRLATPNVGFYVGATVLGWFAPDVAAGFYLLLGVRLVLGAHADHPAPAT